MRCYYVGVELMESKIMTKQKLVHPQMTAEARDILKSWDGESYSEKISSMNYNYFISTKALDKMKATDSDRKALIVNLKEKTKELSTIAGYLAISICINFVAIGWVAWTKGWLS